MQLHCPLEQLLNSPACLTETRKHPFKKKKKKNLFQTFFVE